MYIRITRNVVLEAWRHDTQTGVDYSVSLVCLAGQVFLVAEMSPGEGSTVMEFACLGHADVPDDCWATYEGSVVNGFPNWRAAG